MSDCLHSHDGKPVFNKIVPANQKVANALLKNAKILKLTFDQRQELPHDCTAEDGSLLVCHIDEPVEPGDKLISTDNEWAVIEAAPETLFKIDRKNKAFETFIHIAGLNMWPLELLNDGALVVASHECQHMLEHFGLDFTQIEAAITEINVPEIKHHDCCDHDHHEHHDSHDHKHHGHDHTHDDCGHDHH